MPHSHQSAAGADLSSTIVVSPRDHGLQRGIGVTGLTASLVNTVVGGGIFTLPAAVALQAGNQAPLTYILCAVIMAGVVICFAEAGSRVPTSGGPYGMVEAAFGPAAGIVTGGLQLISNLLADGAIAVALAGMAGPTAPWPHAALIGAIYLAMMAANLLNVRATIRLISVATVVKLLPLLLFVGLTAVFWNTPPPPGAPLPAPTGNGFGHAMILTLFAFSGIETPMLTAGEVATPNRTLPRALFAAMSFVLFLYLSVQLGAQHFLGGALAHAAAPLADAAGRVSQPARIMLLAGAGLSMLAYLASDIMGTARLVFAFARDGILPPWLGRLSPRSRIPSRAVVVYSLCGALLAVSGSFLELIAMSSLFAVGIYVMICAAAFVLHRRNVALAGAPLNFPKLPAACALGIGGMAYMIASARLVEIEGLVAVSVGSLAVHAVRKRLRVGV